MATRFAGAAARGVGLQFLWQRVDASVRNRSCTISRGRSGMSAGDITVHSPSAYGHLRLDGSAEEKAEETSGGHPHVTLPGSSSRSSRGPPSRDMGRHSRASSAARMAHVQTWLTQKARRAVVALSDDPELRDMKELCQSFVEEEKAFIAELDEVLSSHATEKHCKKEMLYHKWSERVFSPLHSQLVHTMDSDQWQALATAKDHLYQQYLDYRKRKAVFLDTTGGDSYEPSSLLGLTAETRVLDDPLHAQAADRASEQLVTGDCQGQSPRRLAAAGLGPVQWLAVQLTYIDSDSRRRSRLCMKRDHNESSKAVLVSNMGMPHKTPIRYPHTPLSLSHPTSLS